MILCCLEGRAPVAQEHTPVRVFTSPHHLLSLLIPPSLLSTVQILSAISVHWVSHILPSAVLSALFFLFLHIFLDVRCQVVCPPAPPPPHLDTFL